MNKKNIIIIISVLILILGVSIFIGYSKNKGTKSTKYTVNDIGKISNLVESTKTLPEDSEIRIYGNYIMPLTDEIIIENAKVYNFDAVVATNGVIGKHNFTGISLKELFESLGITRYDEIRVMTYKEVDLIVKKEDNINNMYLVFEIDNEVLNIGELSNLYTYVNVGVDSRYWAFGIADLTFKTKE